MLKENLPELVKGQQEQLDRLMSKDSMIDRLVIEAIILSLSMATNSNYSEDLQRAMDKKHIKEVPLNKNTAYFVSQCLRIRYSFKEGELRRLLFSRSTSIPDIRPTTNG